MVFDRPHGAMESKRIPGKTISSKTAFKMENAIPVAAIPSAPTGRVAASGRRLGEENR
jgi:hypothetical protein